VIQNIKMPGLEFPGGEVMEPCVRAKGDFNLFLSIMCLIAIPIYMVGGLIILPLYGLGKLADRSSKKYLEGLSQKVAEYSSSQAPLSQKLVKPSWPDGGVTYVANHNS